MDKSDEVVMNTSKNVTKPTNNSSTISQEPDLSSTDIKKKFKKLQEENEKLKKENLNHLTINHKLENMCRKFTEQLRDTKARMKEEQKRNDINDHVQKQLVTFQKLLEDSAEKNKQLSNDNSEMHKKFTQLFKQMDIKEKETELSYQNMKKDLETTNEKLYKIILDKTKDEEKYLLDKTKLLNKISEYQEVISFLKNNESEMQEQLNGFAEKYTGFKDTLSANSEKIRKYTEDMTNMTKKIRTLEEQTRMWKQRHFLSQQESIRLSKDLKKRDEKISEFNKKCCTFDNLFKSLRQERETLKLRIKQLEENNSSNENNLKSNKKTQDKTVKCTGNENNTTVHSNSSIIETPSSIPECLNSKSDVDTLETTKIIEKNDEIINKKNNVNTVLNVQETCSIKETNSVQIEHSEKKTKEIPKNSDNSDAKLNDKVSKDINESDIQKNFSANEMKSVIPEIKDSNKTGEISKNSDKSMTINKKVINEHCNQPKSSTDTMNSLSEIKNSEINVEMEDISKIKDKSEITINNEKVNESIIKSILSINETNSTDPEIKDLKLNLDIAEIAKNSDNSDVIINDEVINVINEFSMREKCFVKETCSLVKEFQNSNPLITTNKKNEEIQNEIVKNIENVKMNGDVITVENSDSVFVEIKNKVGDGANVNDNDNIVLEVENEFETNVKDTIKQENTFENDQNTIKKHNINNTRNNRGNKKKAKSKK